MAKKIFTKIGKTMKNRVSFLLLDDNDDDDDDDDDDGDDDDDDDDVTCKKNAPCSCVLLRGCSIYDRSDPSLQVVGGCHTFKTIICS